MNITTNSINRVPRSADPVDEVDVYSVADLPDMITAPDGILRVPLVQSTVYRVHKTFSWPRLLIPSSVSQFFEPVVLKGIEPGIALLINGDDTPHIWGRNINSLAIEEMSIVDPLFFTTKLFDIVGGESFSFISTRNVVFSSFRSLGRTVDINFDFSNVPIVNISRGITNRSCIGFTSAHITSAIRLSQPPGALFSQNSATFAFLGFQETASILGGNIRIGAGSDVILIDEGSPGEYLVTALSYDGTPNLFAVPVSESLSAMVANDTSITVFSDSAVDPGVDTTVTASSHGFVKGQIINITGSTSYNGLHTITRVAADEGSFDIAVVFVSDEAPSTVSMTTVTYAGTKLVEDQTVTVSGTTNYNGTFNPIFVDDNTFTVPVDFVANDAAGTVVATPNNERSIGVNATSNGHSPESRAIAFGAMNANINTTSVIDGTYVPIDVTGTVEVPVTERFTLTAPANGVFTYNGDRNTTVTILAIVSATKSGSTEDYRFAVSINGAAPVFASAPYAPMEVKTAKVSAQVLSPIPVVTGDTIQLMVAGDGTGDSLLITDFVVEIKA